MDKIDLLQGTLDMLILRVLARGEMHGWGIVDRLGQLSRNALKLGEGSVYPSLYRMETKGWIKQKEVVHSCPTCKKEWVANISTTNTCPECNQQALVCPVCRAKSS